MSKQKHGRLEFNQIETQTQNNKIKSIIESILFAAIESISLKELFNILKNDFSLTKLELSSLLDELKEEYLSNSRGFELIYIAEGFQLKTKKKYAKWVEKTLKKKISYERLSKSALETLSIIAYKQPVTRAEIEEIRGVNVDGIMRVLLDKGLIFASGKKDSPGKPGLYSTTKLFLTTFGLKNLQELPPLGELNLN